MSEDKIQTIKCKLTSDNYAYWSSGARQRDLSIQDSYIEMTGLWDQLALMEPFSLKTLNTYVEFRKQGRLVQFLTALSPQYEAIRGASFIGLLSPLWILLFVSSSLKKPVLRRPVRLYLHLIGYPRSRLGLAVELEISMWWKAYNFLSLPPPSFVC
ncbi:hypothetical protein CsSME_00050140 [Camellia sinensis var. sinensis]